MAVDDPRQPASVPTSTMTAVRQGLVPGWLDRLAAIGWRVLVVIALALVFASIAVFLETVTGAILVGLTVAAMVYPIVVSQVRRGWPRGAPRRRRASCDRDRRDRPVRDHRRVHPVDRRDHPGEPERGRGPSSFPTDRGAPPAVLEVVDRAVTGVQAWVVDGLAQLVGPIAAFTTIVDPRRLPDVLPARGR
jgi:hypothetical protein